MARLEYILIAHRTIETKNMDDQGFLILRKQRYWDHNQPVYYPGNRNPYKKLIEVGKKVIIEKELAGEINFIGYGEIDSIEEIQPEPGFGPDYTTKVHFKDYVHFFPPRMKNHEIRIKLLKLPDYQWYGSIRPITRDIFYEIIDFCLDPDSKQDWTLFLNELLSKMTSLPSPEIDTSIDDILNKNESELLEFKSSMLHLTQKSITQNSKVGNSDVLRESNLKEIIQREIATAIVAFLNSKGGTLIVGVDDNHNILGIENDYKELSKKKDWDGWILHFRNLLKKYIDDELVSQQLKLKSYIKDGKTIVRIDVPESPKPNYLIHGNERHFYIRSFNSSEKLNTKYAVDYMDRKRELKK